MTALSTSYGPVVGGRDASSILLANSERFFTFTNPVDHVDQFEGGLNRVASTGIVSSGTVTTDVNNPNSIKISSGTTAGGVGQCSIGGTTSMTWVGGSSTKGYIRFRQKFTTAVASDAYGMLYVGGLTLQIGYRGSIHATKFVAAGDTGSSPTLTSTVSVDNGNWHLLEFWQSGTNAWFSVDNESPLTSTSLYTTATAAQLLFIAYNGGTAAARTFNVSEFACRIERP